MDGLPRDLMHKILFMIDHRSVAMMRCTNRSLQTHTNDPDFESEYSSRVGSGLVHISLYSSYYLSYNPSGDFRSLKMTVWKTHILGSCSGFLLLLFDDDLLCVVNPLTKKFRFVNQSRLMRLSGVLNYAHHRQKRKHLGFAVDRTTKRFKIVHMIDLGETYKFEINAGNSWRRPKTKLTCHSSDLMKNPVYLDGSLHWLRNDGSIVAFNLETEQARLIPIKFPQVNSLKTLFAVGNRRLTLISATEKDIYVYALESILNDPKWVLVNQIMNVVADIKRPSYWYLEAYEGKCLVLRENSKREEIGLYYNRVVHVYDLTTNKRVFMDSIPGWFNVNQVFFQFTPSTSYVVGLDEILPCDDTCISSLSTIMAMVDERSSEKVENQLRKRSAEHNLLQQQSAYKKTRLV